MNIPSVDGGAAFPCTGEGFASSLYTQHGMSLRDWFAGQALAAIPHIGCGADLDTLDTALAAYQLADAMIAARAQVRA